jgi:hypothetical protein
MIDAEQMADDLAPSEEDAVGLGELGQLALDCEVRIKALQDQVKTETAYLNRVMTHLIPAMMAEIGLDEFGFNTEDGGRARLMLGTVLQGSLRYAPDEAEAVRYLEENGFPGGVLTEMSVSFTEDERGEIEVLMDNIKDNTGKSAHVERKINPSTLKAFVRSQLEADPTWDYEKVGIKAWQASTFSQRK